MKKLFLLLTFMIGAQAYADEYTYLTFETATGEKTSVSLKGLAIKISGATLTVGEQTFLLSNLGKMYFSNSNETTGVSQITKEELDDAQDIYDLKGNKITKEQMQKGIYVVKKNGATYKITAR